MREYRFYKDSGTNTWWIDLPKFPFNKSWLQMVLGADSLLEKLSKGSNEVRLKVSTKTPKHFDNVLIRVLKLGVFKGAIYKGGTSSLIPSNDLGNNVLWLCPATLWVFLRYPKKIYYEIIS